MGSRPLVLITITLFGLVLLSRSRRAANVVVEPPPVALEPAPPPPPPARRAPRVAPLPGVMDLATGSSSPAMDRMAILAVRRRLSRGGAGVYLDSAWALTDSTVVRWPDRGRQPMMVSFTGDTSLVGWSDRYLEVARLGMRSWGSNAPGLRFEETDDPLEADIEVMFVQNVSASGEFGVTELNWDGGGEARHAVIRLALSPDSLVPLVPAQVMRRVAIHEFGHALGLPHSGGRDDIMFPSSPVSAPSRRDHATLQLLYAVPPGTLRLP